MYTPKSDLAQKLSTCNALMFLYVWGKMDKLSLCIVSLVSISTNLAVTHWLEPAMLFLSSFRSWPKYQSRNIGKRRKLCPFSLQKFYNFGYWGWIEARTLKRDVPFLSLVSLGKICSSTLKTFFPRIKFVAPFFSSFFEFFAKCHWNLPKDWRIQRQ